MEDQELSTLEAEIREDYQIPPYFPENSLKNFIKEGEMWLLSLNAGCDVKKDLTFRSLLKNYVYYAVHHKIDEFQKNYASLILTWQLTTEIPDETKNAETESEGESSE